MRRSLIAAPLLLLTLCACGGPNATGNPQTGNPAGTTTTASPDPVTDALISMANPCHLVTAADLDTIFSSTSFHLLTVEGVDPDDPPVTGTPAERNCGYTGTVPGVYSDNPNDGTGTQITVMVTSNVDDADGAIWRGTVEGGRMAAQGGADISRTEFREVTNIGDGAFFSGPGWLNAHKGRVIIEVNSPDDTEGVLDDSKAAAIMLQAFTRVTNP